MAVPQNKEELITSIQDTYAKLDKELTDIPRSIAKLQELPGHAKGTQMSVADLVAYLIGWALLVLKWHDRKSKGLSVDFPETGYKWNELGKLAQRFYADHNDLDYEMRLQKLDESVTKILVLIASHTNEELYGMPWYNQWTMGKMIQLNTSSPYKNARNRIRSWKKNRS